MNIHVRPSGALMATCNVPIAVAGIRVVPPRSFEVRTTALLVLSSGKLPKARRRNGGQYRPGPRLPGPCRGR